MSRPANVRLFVALALAGCASPERLSLRRSPMLEIPQAPLTPEGRPTPIPLESPHQGTAEGAAFGRTIRLESPHQGTAEGAAFGRTIRLEPRAVARPEAPGVDGEKLAETARGFLGRRALAVDDRSFPNDCTGLVRAVYATHGVDLMADGGRPSDGGVAAIWRYAGRHGSLHEDQPQPGDIVFYRETYDRNRDGRANDGLTHVGIVEAVEPDGTVSVIHRVARGVMRYHMNLSHPRDRRDAASGRVLNDTLREGRRSRFAAELFAGYATLAR
jgi:hypothetical protein